MWSIWSVRLRSGNTQQLISHAHPYFYLYDLRSAHMEKLTPEIAKQYFNPKNQNCSWFSNLNTSAFNTNRVNQSSIYAKELMCLNWRKFSTFWQTELGEEEGWILFEQPRFATIRSSTWGWRHFRYNGQGFSDSASLEKGTSYLSWKQMYRPPSIWVILRTVKIYRSTHAHEALERRAALVIMDHHWCRDNARTPDAVEWWSRMAFRPSMACGQPKLQRDQREPPQQIQTLFSIPNKPSLLRKNCPPLWIGGCSTRFCLQANADKPI